MDKFVAYVGPPELHDGRIVRVTSKQDTITVLVTGDTGCLFSLVFYGVIHHHAVTPEGMTLYALTEEQDSLPHRKFVFVNWNEEDSSELSIVAAGFRVLDGGQTMPLSVRAQ
jgi:hypothetical protein